MTGKTLFMAIATVASALSISLPADAGKPGRASVAVVIDQDCYSQTKDAVNEYVDAMELDGKTGILLIDEWGVPDSRPSTERRHSKGLSLSVIFRFR